MIIVIEGNSIECHIYFFRSILLHNADDSIDVTNDEEPEQETETDQQQTAILPVPGFVPPASLYNHAQETVYETSARLLFMAVKWAKNLPRYFSISYLPDYVLSLVMIYDLIHYIFLPFLLLPYVIKVSLNWLFVIR